MPHAEASDLQYCVIAINFAKLTRFEPDMQASVICLPHASFACRILLPALVDGFADHLVKRLEDGF